MTTENKPQISFSKSRSDQIWEDWRKGDLTDEEYGDALNAEVGRRIRVSDRIEDQRIKTKKRNKSSK